MTNLQRRLRKLETQQNELRRLKDPLDGQPEGYWKRLVMEKIEAISQRQQAARDRGVYVAPVDVGYVKERLRACLAAQEADRGR